MSPTADTSPAPSRVIEETDWKLQRKLKHHQRDAGRRSAESRAEPRFKSHTHHQHRANVMRLEKEAWLPTPTKSARRTIPEQLRHSPATSGVRNHASQLSRSGPSATSWPPGMTATEELDEAMDSLSLASSAPSTAYAGRQDEHRREARPMTLFESARIFNESGQLLSHDNFDELGSSPEMIVEGTPKRKFKRRVGRRKHETKRTNAVDTLNTDEVVLELMCLLFPDVEVTQELNLLLLGSAQHEDVFHFDEDDIVDIPAATKPKCGVLDIDLLNPRDVAETLQEMYFTPQWIAHEMLAMVKLDVLAQYDRFAVMNAIFRTISDKRSCILAAAASASLAIFQHQGLSEITSRDSGKEIVTVKGMIAFLNAAMDVIERDARYNAEVFGTSDERSVMRAIRLLVRSSPGGSGNSDSNRNQLEKYAECSDSAEATTYRAMGELVNRMAAFSPMHGEEFLRWMLLKWPQRNVQLQLFFVRFTAGLLSQFMLLGLMFPADVVRRAFTRIQACIQSTHFLVAQEACNMCGNFQLMSVYLSCDQALREKIASALHENATSHWNQRIREISDECFDMLLDLA
ncbi:Armadillo-type fold [Phytophthora cactorum]|nr:Armadillo-type fold [Phytophthora cactorum]